MARFRGTVVGNRSVASRLGHATSGLEVTANGWNFGVRVELVADDKNERDVAHIFLTGGSNGGRETYLGEFDKNSAQTSPPRIDGTDPLAGKGGILERWDRERIQRQEDA
jgi:hypothetical protein